eukprot:SAG11_NODE_18234_length_496_cov_1.614610_2_plen_42_part_01
MVARSMVTRNACHLRVMSRRGREKEMRWKRIIYAVYIYIFFF